MEKEDLIKLIASGLTISEIAKVTNVGRSTVSYYLGKYELKTNNQQKPRLIGHFCRKCEETDPTKFYGNDKMICSSCHTKRVNTTGRENREYAIEKLGGKCVNCSYSKYIGGLDIHHLDPNIKDKNFKSMRGWSKSRIDKEIKNCILLCKNCHCELHGGLLENGELVKLAITQTLQV